MRRDRSKITVLVVHCSPTPNGDRQWTTAHIDKWHAERGFQRDVLSVATFQPHLPHIGYHDVIEINGRCAHGRSIDEIGAHAKGFNTNSLGVCLIGTDQFTRAQWCTLQRVVRDYCKQFPGLRLIGHREVSEKACPGFDIPTWQIGGMVPPAARTL